MSDLRMIEAISNIAGRFDLRGLVLYGSMVNDETTAVDADVIYFRIKKLHGKEYFELMNTLSDLLQKDKVDLVYWNDAYPLLKNEAALKNEILFGDRDWIQTQLRAGQREYWDAIPYYNALDEKLKHQLNVAW